MAWFIVPFKVVHVALVGLLLVVALVVVLVVLVVVVLLLCLSKLCNVAYPRHSVKGPDSVKPPLRQSTAIHQPSNSFACSCLALNFGLHEGSQTATCIWLRAPVLRYRQCVGGGGGL